MTLNSYHNNAMNLHWETLYPVGGTACGFSNLFAVFVPTIYHGMWPIIVPNNDSNDIDDTNELMALSAMLLNVNVFDHSHDTNDTTEIRFTIITRKTNDSNSIDKNKNDTNTDANKHTNDIDDTTCD